MTHQRDLTLLPFSVPPSLPMPGEDTWEGSHLQDRKELSVEADLAGTLTLGFQPPLLWESGTHACLPLSFQSLLPGHWGLSVGPPASRGASAADLGWPSHLCPPAFPFRVNLRTVTTVALPWPNVLQWLPVPSEKLRLPASKAWMLVSAALALATPPHSQSSFADCISSRCRGLLSCVPQLHLGHACLGLTSLSLLSPPQVRMGPYRGCDLQC